jgi:predicted metal-binding protein
MTRMRLPMPATALLVCTRCRDAEADPAQPRPGSALLAATRTAAQLHPQLVLQGIACLSGCRRPCAAAVLGHGKVS